MKIKKFQNSGKIQRDNTKVNKPFIPDMIGKPEKREYTPSYQGEISQGKDPNIITKIHDWYNSTPFRRSPMADALRVTLPGFATVEKLVTGEPAEEYEAMAMLLPEANLLKEIELGSVARGVTNNALKWKAGGAPLSKNFQKAVDLSLKRRELMDMPNLHYLDKSELAAVKRQLEDVEYELSLLKGNSSDWNKVEEIAHKKHLKMIDQQKKSQALEDALYNSEPAAADIWIEEGIPAKSYSMGWNDSAKSLRAKSTKDLHFDKATSNEKRKAIQDADPDTLFKIKKAMKNSPNAVEKAMSTEAGVVYGRAKRAGLPNKDRVAAVRERLLMLMDNPDAFLKNGGILKLK